MEDNQNAGGPVCNPGWYQKGARSHGFLGGAYFLAFIGAAVYYLQNSHTFWMGVLGILKAMVWPALVVYKLLEFLKM